VFIYRKIFFDGEKLFLKMYLKNLRFNYQEEQHLILRMSLRMSQINISIYEFYALIFVQCIAHSMIHGTFPQEFRHATRIKQHF